MSRATRAESPRATTVDGPIIIVDEFLPAPLAAAMRRDIDAHFAHPEAHRRETHQVWNYWFVPALYTYLRTAPEQVIGRDHMAAFHDALRQWSASQLGLAEVSWPYLSLYVDGCRQGWHNDARNGRFGFVYSLTRDQRRTIGGQTLVWREGDAFRRHLATAAAGSGLYEVIEPRFNRLLIFDDRLPHAVERIEGSMDPVEGRFVLHGHLREAGAIVVGSLQADEVAATLNETLAQFAKETAARTAVFHGPLTLRLTIDPSGEVELCEVLLDRVVHRDYGNVEWEGVRTLLIARLSALKFASAAGPTMLIQPILFGGRDSSLG